MTSLLERRAVTADTALRLARFFGTTAQFWMNMAPGYVRALKGNDPVISFMTLAEVRFGALLAVWGYRKRDLLEQYLADFAVCYPDERIGQRLEDQLPQRCQYRSAIGSIH